LCIEEAEYTLHNGGATRWFVTPDDAFTITDSDFTWAKVQATSPHGRLGTLTAVVSGTSITKSIQACVPTISGLATLCNEGSYELSIPNLPATWSFTTSNSGFEILPPFINVNSVTVRATCLNGQSATLRAMVNGVPIETTVRACGASISGPSWFCINGSYTLNAVGNQHRIEWTINPSDAAHSIRSVDYNRTILIRNPESNATSMILTAHVNGASVSSNTISLAPVIEGPDVICNSAQYTSCGYEGQVHWTVSSGFSLTVHSPTSVTVTANTPGITGTLQMATVGAPLQVVTFSKAIRSCPPPTISGSSKICRFSVYTLENAGNAQVGSWTIEPPSASFTIIPQSSTSVRISRNQMALNNTQDLTLIAKATNGSEIARRSIQVCPIILGPDIFCVLGTYELCSCMWLWHAPTHHYRPHKAVQWAVSSQFTIVYEDEDLIEVFGTFPPATASGGILVLTDFGEFYSRLIQSDCHNSTQQNFMASQMNYIVYPNPVSSTLHFQADASQFFRFFTNRGIATNILTNSILAATSGELLLFGMQGNLMLRQPISNLYEDFEINVSSIPNGMYVATVISGERVVYSQNIVVQH
jgi:hypothetical protein